MTFVREGLNQVTERVEMTRVSTLGSDVTIHDGPAELVALVGEGASGSVVTLKDGATTKASLPAGMVPLGGELPFHSARFDASLVVNIAATGGVNLIALWRPIG